MSTSSMVQMDSEPRQSTQGSGADHSDEDSPESFVEDPSSSFSQVLPDTLQPYELETPEKIFATTILAFQDSLSDEDRAQFKNYDDPRSLVKDLEAHVHKLKSGEKMSRVLACCQRIHHFANRWEPFFEVTSIVISSHPDYAAFAWGAIRLIFQLGTNFVTFLEKLTDMFERIADVLPTYHAHIQRIRELPYPASRLRLGKALSYVYADIIQFCQEAYHLLHRKRGSHFSNSRNFFVVINTLFWKPFDIRFGDIITRLKQHQEMLEREIHLQDQLALGQFFRRYEARIREYDLGQAEDEQLRPKTDQRQTESDKSFRLRVQRETMKYQQQKINKKQAYLTKGKKELALRYREIKLWLKAPDYMAIFEEAKRSRHADTCQWILEEEAYVSWWCRPTDRLSMNDPSRDIQSLPFTSRILSLQANPGFGKTVLSTILIEDIHKHCEIRDSWTTAFFHFDAEHTEKRSRFQAWRSLISIILYKYRTTQEVIDMVSVLMDTKGMGQFNASDGEVEELLRLLLNHIPAFLVFDGVDECEDTSEFLRTLYDICQDTETKLLFLSRPTVTFPLSYRRNTKDTWRLRLNQSQNLADIQNFIMTKVNELVVENLIGDDFTAEEIAEDVAGRANGMFLWATLMVNYIGCRALSPAERLDALLELDLLEGLESIYTRIMQVMTSLYAKEKERMFQIFQWMLVAYRPMKLGEMHTAAAVSPGAPTLQGQYIIDFEHTLAVSSLGLVELRNGEVRFIHSSVHEFLMTGDSSKISFSPNNNAAHLSLATACLSYLTFDMPTMPLSCLTHTPSINNVGPCSTRLPMRHLAQSTYEVRTRNLGFTRDGRRTSVSLADGDPETSPAPYHPGQSIIHGLPTLKRRLADLEEHLPFVCYAAQCWAYHFQESLSTYDMPLTPAQFQHCRLFFEILSSFLVNRFLVTLWVEGSYMLNLLPDITDLVVPFSKLGEHNFLPGPARREYAWMKDGLRQLALALLELRDKYSHMLLLEPAEIWTPGIAKATDPNFWPVWMPPKKRKREQEQEEGMKVKAEDGEGVTVSGGRLMNAIGSWGVRVEAASQ